LALVSANQLLSLEGRENRRGYRRVYSQFGEDVILQNLVGNFQGRYVDIGSGHPVRGNNTFTLYRKGWSGFLIDPLRNNVELARKKRPRDISMQALVGSTVGEQQFWEYETYEFSTTQLDRVDELGEQGIHPACNYLMKSITLTSLRVNATPQDPYVLSIDVEGSEMEVLRGNNWMEFTPPIILIEEHAHPWIRVSEIKEFLHLYGYELNDYVGLTSVYIHIKSPFRVQRSNPRI
jgi:FkbM family methyltransferase